MIRQRLSVFLTTTLLMLVVAGCGQPAATPNPAALPIAPVIAASELVIGVNRLPFGLLQGGVPLNDPDLTLDVTLYYVGPGGDRTKPVATTQAVYRGQGLPVGLYVAYATFATGRVVGKPKSPFRKLMDHSLRVFVLTSVNVRSPRW
ncbi:hypothetical protein [Chloroflexus sp.]|uniref:hypothetical protein n=1 Tax=Chloroflexus sp. TaxID=1904827 RepID=UPI004049FF79